MLGQSVLETCKISSKPPAHILKHHMWNLLINKPYDSIYSTLWFHFVQELTVKIGRYDRQQDPPHFGPLLVPSKGQDKGEPIAS